MHFICPPCLLDVRMAQPWFHHPNNIWWWVQIVKLPLCRPLHPAFTSFLFVPASASLLLHPFSLFQIISSLHLPVTSFFLVPAHALKLCYYLRVRGQVSHPYKTKDKITVIYVLIIISCHINIIIKSDSE